MWYEPKPLILFVLHENKQGVTNLSLSKHEFYSKSFENAGENAWKIVLFISFMVLQSILVLKISRFDWQLCASFLVVQRVAVSLARTTTARALKYNYHVPKATQVILVIELYDTSFRITWRISYHKNSEILCNTGIFFLPINQWNCCNFIYWVIIPNVS